MRILMMLAALCGVACAQWDPFDAPTSSGTVGQVHEVAGNVLVWPWEAFPAFEVQTWGEPVSYKVDWYGCGIQYCWDFTVTFVPTDLPTTVVATAGHSDPPPTAVHIVGDI